MICRKVDGSTIEIHHVRKLNKAFRTGFNRTGKKTSNWNPSERFRKLLSAINRKQIPVCKNCHDRIHKREYDGISLKDLAYPEIAKE